MIERSHLKKICQRLTDTKPIEAPQTANNNFKVLFYFNVTLPSSFFVTEIPDFRETTGRKPMLA